jgi:hypothetical protein
MARCARSRSSILLALLLSVLAACSASDASATPTDAVGSTGTPSAAPSSTAPSPLPSTPPSPSPRGYHFLLDVADRGVLMLLGFNASPPSGGHLLPDMWTYQPGGDWQPLEAACDFSQCLNGAPKQPGPVAFDRSAATVLMLEDNMRGTFTFDVTRSAWSDPVSIGPTQLGGAMAYDAESERFVFFGGESDHTWTFDPDANAWTQMEPALAPAGGNYHMMSYDPVSDRSILFGGAGSRGPLNGTWAYDVNGDSWTDLAPATSPPSRYYGALAYDPTKARFILFGGLGESGVLGDTWAYDPAANSWSQIEAAGPSARAWHAMAFDAESGLIVLFGGGETRDTYLADTWIFDPAADTWMRASS